MEFDLRIKVQRYNEITGTQLETGELSPELKQELRDHIEYAVQKTPFIVTEVDGFQVFVYGIKKKESNDSSN